MTVSLNVTGAEKVKRNEEAGEFLSNEKREKNPEKATNEIEKSNVPEREFKALAIIELTQ